MRYLKTLIALVITLIIVFSVAGASFAAKADVLMERAHTDVVKAESTKSSADKTESYEKALETYAKVAKDFRGTPQAAEALYRSAIIRKEAKGKLHNLYMAHEALKTLVIQYDKPADKLAEALDSAEVRQVQRTVEKGKELRTEIEITLDKKHKTEGYYAILYKIIDSLVQLTGARPGFSYWFAIILLTVIIKIIITPLTKKQFKSMKEMQVIAPKIKELQAKHKGDQKTIGEKTMELYKEHNINPFASCLPLLIQMPIIMVLWYTMKAYEFQFAKGTFLWIGSSLSHLWSVAVPGFMTPGSVVWVTAKSLAEPDLILVVLYLVSMYISTKMSAVDPTQADQQKMMAIIMPVMFAFIFAGFPSAFLLYWLVLNILQTVQQYFILRAPVPVPAAGITPAPGTGPAPSSGGGGDKGTDSAGGSNGTSGSSRSRRRRRR